MKARGAPRRISRGVRVKPERSPRKPPLLSLLLLALDARPDVTVLTRAWPVLFVQLRYALEKTVVNPNSMSPLHRETPLFYGQAWEARRAGANWALAPVPVLASVAPDDEDVVMACVDAAVTLVYALGKIHDEVAVRLGLQKPVERDAPIVGRPMER